VRRRLPRARETRGGGCRHATHCGLRPQPCGRRRPAEAARGLRPDRRLSPVTAGDGWVSVRPALALARPVVVPYAHPLGAIRIDGRFVRGLHAAADAGCGSHLDSNPTQRPRPPCRGRRRPSQRARSYQTVDLSAACSRLTDGVGDPFKQPTCCATATLTVWPISVESSRFAVIGLAPLTAPRQAQPSGENRALPDAERDLDSIEPRGVDGRVNQDAGGPTARQPPESSALAVGSLRSSGARTRRQYLPLLADPS